MTTPSEWPAVADDVERRLHPLSWVFVVLQQMKALIVPLLLVVVTGRGSRNAWVLIALATVAITAVIRYLTYRFRLGPDGVVITSGVFQRTRRDIPYERIHNVVVHQSPFHRLMGVADVTLESAGGSTPEGEMRVLALHDAHAIEQLIRSRGIQRAAAGAAGSASDAVPVLTLLRLPPAEVVKLGLISNRGLVVVTAAFGLMWQALPDDWSPVEFGQAVFEWLRAHASEVLPHWLLEPAGLVAGTLMLFAAAVVLVRTFSVALALLQFYGFTLDEIGRQLQVQRGLLTRVRYHLPRRRIQAWRLQETWLHRRFARQSLRIDSAGGSAGEAGHGTSDLAPIATPEAMQALINTLLPNRGWPPAEWCSLHPRAWRRVAAVPATIVILASAALALRYGWLALLMLVLVPAVIVRARLWARHTGFAEVGEGLVAIREGWFNRRWQFTEVRKLQALRITESPFDRRHGMLTLWLDTAGASGGIIRIPYLPANEARTLHDRLAAGLNP